MKIEGYAGVCEICFRSIEEESELHLRENEKNFHRVCAERDPNSYYLVLERIRGQFEQGTNPTDLMNQMEIRYKIPLLNDERFNEENPEVIELYRQISDSRAL